MAINLQLPPCVLFEDEHLLVVNKPAGLNTHAPAPYAGEGIYDWLRHREPRWASLAIIHRLDKETSGLLVFGKTTLANRSLTEQFTRREVHKKYLLVTDRRPARPQWQTASYLQRAGDKYVSRPGGVDSTFAETRFQLILGPGESRPTSVGEKYLIEAQPLTGRTHQIRVHAAESGCPILGDTLYGGSPAPRLCLHAVELVLQHPATGGAMRFECAPQFDEDARLMLRRRLIQPEETNAYRLVQGVADDAPGCYVDVFGDYLLVQSEQEDRQKLNFQHRTSNIEHRTWNVPSLGYPGSDATGIYFKLLDRQVRRARATEACPQLMEGKPAPERFGVRENGVAYELSFQEGYSVGLFLDQRDNRRRFLTGHVAADFPLSQPGLAAPQVLNVFAYTCAFSVCAALGGARTTSLDLSKKYLEWGKRNFALNGLDPAQHDFIFGDAFNWLKRLAKKTLRYDVIVLDPPTFSQSKEHGVFRAEKDYGQLVAAALPLLKPGGVLLASTNAAGLAPEIFLNMVMGAIGKARRRIRQQHYAPQPPDFPITRAEPGFLKTVWLRVE